MSSSSDSARRPSQQALPDQTEVRRGSKYEIYGTETKPFGESYRRSLLLQEQDQDSGHGQEREDSSVDTDSVEETMGCSVSKREVALNGDTVKGSFGTNPSTETVTEVKPTTDLTDSDDNKVKKTKKPTDFEIIYGFEKANNGYSNTEIYSEVKKSEKLEKETNQINDAKNQTPREKLMQQIRERKEEPKEKAIGTTEQEENKSRNKNEKDAENALISSKAQDDKMVNTVVSSAPISFVEEEYSYEPEKQEATSKIVVRSRSLVNLDQSQFNYNSTMTCTLKRPNALKMTTKPDGTIRYGLRQGSSESDLLDKDEMPPQENEIKNNYVNSIKSAFDAAIERQSQDTMGKAQAFDGLRQYFHDNKHGLQELLVNNNVVIIEPFRPDAPRSPGDQSDVKHRTCRITGATIKSPISEQNKLITTSNTLPRRNTKSRQNKQGFYHPIKVNKELIDAELPDPDKVKTARELFEKVFKSNSTSEIPSKVSPSKPIVNARNEKVRITAEVKVIKNGKQSSDDKRRQGRFAVDQSVVLREDVRRYPIQRRWTDSGSLSSGVSSDFSCDQDWEFHPHHDGYNNSSNQEILEEYTSDDDGEYIYPFDVDEVHPVSTEVMQKIRACGTTVTYYGGKVISRSHGQFRSPMTMTIMDEIKQGGGASAGRKKFEPEHQEPYLGVKFRLVKSNSCGSRLEIAGTEEETAKLVSPRHEDFRGKCIEEETSELKEEQTSNVEAEEKCEEINVMQEETEECKITASEEEEDKAEADRYVTNVEVKNPQVMTWAELKLKEARKQWHCAPEAVRAPSQDMEFETFEVMDESSPHKAELSETGRG